jgi:hypothetical protein
LIRYNYGVEALDTGDNVSMSNPVDPDRELKVQVLSLEYQTLRGSILMRTSARYQFLGFTTAAAAILATGAGSRSFGAEVWFLAILAGGIFLFGAGSFWYLGSEIAYQSRRVAEVERRINGLVPVDSDHGPLLSWDSDHQRRTRFDQWFWGHRVSEKRAMSNPISSSKASDP